MKPALLETERLILRQWQEGDFPLFAEINADPAVMEYYPNTLSEDESHAMAAKLKALISEHSWGFWAVMERLKMKNMAANFEHPIIPENHPLREHALYKITAKRWIEENS